jgi:hypothetical protein
MFENKRDSLLSPVAFVFRKRFSLGVAPTIAAI